MNYHLKSGIHITCISHILQSCTKYFFLLRWSRRDSLYHYLFEALFKFFQSCCFLTVIFEVRMNIRNTVFGSQRDKHFIVSIIFFVPGDVNIADRGLLNCTIKILGLEMLNIILSNRGKKTSVAKIFANFPNIIFRKNFPLLSELSLIMNCSFLLRKNF